MITVFTPSFADESNTNAQNLTVKEVVARMDPSRFRVVMFGEGATDPRIAARPNTKILRWRKRGNTARVLWYLLTHAPDVYFFPRESVLETVCFSPARSCIGRRLWLPTWFPEGSKKMRTGRSCGARFGSVTWSRGTAATCRRRSRDSEDGCANRL